MRSQLVAGGMLILARTLLTRRSQSLKARSVLSRSVAGGDGLYCRGLLVGHYTLISNTEPSRWGGGRSPFGMQTLARTLLTRRSQSLAAR